MVTVKKSGDDIAEVGKGTVFKKGIDGEICIRYDCVLICAIF